MIAFEKLILITIFKDQFFILSIFMGYDFKYNFIFWNDKIYKIKRLLKESVEIEESEYSTNSYKKTFRYPIKNLIDEKFQILRLKD